MVNRDIQLEERWLAIGEEVGDMGTEGMEGSETRKP
jgi:hypothetical protein